MSIKPLEIASRSVNCFICTVSVQSALRISQSLPLYFVIITLLFYYIFISFQQYKYFFRRNISQIYWRQSRVLGSLDVEENHSNTSHHATVGSHGLELGVHMIRTLTKAWVDKLEIFGVMWLCTLKTGRWTMTTLYQNNVQSEHWLRAVIKAFLNLVL